MNGIVDESCIRLRGQSDEIARTSVPSVDLDTFSPPWECLCEHADGQEPTEGMADFERVARKTTKGASITDVDPAVHDLERSRFSAFATELPGAMYVTVIGLVSALITDSVSLGPG